MIDLNKKYKTRDGREARILATDLGGAHPVVAAINHSKDEEVVLTYNSEGRFTSYPSFQDLLEVQPTYTRWLVMTQATGYTTHQEAQDVVTKYNLKAAAIVATTFTLGEGL